jgi:2-C-methyl-D-erythritol 4-phosphate cytidylyltransferase
MKEEAGCGMSALSAVIVAAGSGTRMGSAECKQYLTLGDKPVLVHALEAFQRCDAVRSIVLVVRADDVERGRRLALEYNIGKCSAVVAGGADRQQSVYAGLQALDRETEWVMVHDGVRPFVTVEQIERLWAAVQRHEAAVLAVPVKDTVKLVHPEGWIEATPDRSRLWAIQTPQAFRLDMLIRAHEAAQRDGFRGTDDAVLVERIGQRVRIVEGDYSNIKMTTPEDMQWGSFWLKGRREQ